MVAVTKDQLIAKTKAAIREVTPDQTRVRLEQNPTLLLLDVREGDEVSTGKVKQAVHVPRGFLELKIEGLERNRDREIIVYCAGGLRSALAARSLHEMGYTNVSSMAGG